MSAVLLACGTYIATENGWTLDREDGAIYVAPKPQQPKPQTYGCTN